MATLLSELIATAPADSSSASGLAGEVRDLKSFLKTWCAVAHSDSGTLKTNALNDAGQVGAGVITTAMLSNNAVTQDKLAAEAVGASEIEEDAILQRHINDNAVGGDQIAVGAVGADGKAHIATDGISLSAMIKDGVVTSDKIAALDGTKLVDGSVTGAKLAAATIEASKLQHDTGWGASDYYLPIMTKAGSTYAKIAGAIAVSLAGSTATFSISATGANIGTARLLQGTTGATSAAAVVHRGPFTSGSGTDVASVQGASNEKIRLEEPGLYLVFFTALGYSCGKFQAAFRGVSTADYILGSSAVAAVGDQAVSQGFGFITTTVVDTDYYLDHWADLTVANGQGIASGANFSGFSGEVYAQITIVQLA